MIPFYVYKIAEVLEANGFECYLVGGSIRNILMDIPAKDFDLTTNALPEQIENLFPKSIMTNAKFGTVIVMIESEVGELESVEVTTFRLEKDYFGGRWPSHVEFTPNLADDLKRRDFTVNTLALRLINNYELRITNLNELKNSGKIIDLFGGISDLNNKIIRAVGDPVERFTEDGLRTLRACRLASVYNFEIEEKTFDAISATLEITNQISMERVRDEFIKLILKSPKPSLGIDLMRKSGLLKLFIPELLEGFGIEQNKYHIHDVYQHALDTVDITPPEIRIAALFHDIAKPKCKDGDHFYGHDQEGQKMVTEILTRLKFPKKEIEDIANLVRWHMFFIPSGKLKIQNSKFKSKEDQIDHVNETEKRNKHFQTGWSDNAIRRLIIKVGGHEQIDKLLKLRIADALSNPKSSFDPKDIQNLSERIAEIREKESIMSVKDLEINGKDLLELGFKEGPEIRKVLEELLEKVVDDIELNTKEKLIEIVREMDNALN